MTTTAKKLLVAEIEVPEDQTAESVLDTFRAMVQPYRKYGILLYLAADPEDVKQLKARYEL